MHANSQITALLLKLQQSCAYTSATPDINQSVNLDHQPKKTILPLCFNDFILHS